MSSLISALAAYSNLASVSSTKQGSCVSRCSPLSTPDAILNAFHSARQSNLGHKSTIVCVCLGCQEAVTSQLLWPRLLDEVGLAEESPHLPLKVLHKEGFGAELTSDFN